MMSEYTKINEKILKKLEKFSSEKNELKICEQLLLKELLWHDLEDPPFKRDFPPLMNKFFPYSKSDEK